MAIQSNGAPLLESSSSDRTEIIIQAPRPTFIINSTFASYLMLPQTPAPALGFHYSQQAQQAEFGWRTRATLQARQTSAAQAGHELLLRQSLCSLTHHTPLRAHLPRCWQHVALHSHQRLKISRRFNTGGISSPNLSAAEMTVASPERTGRCSWVTISAPLLRVCQWLHYSVQSAKAFRDAI